jgi:hypothetical protein
VKIKIEERRKHSSYNNEIEIVFKTLIFPSSGGYVKLGGGEDIS